MTITEARRILLAVGLVLAFVVACGALVNPVVLLPSLGVISFALIVLGWPDKKTTANPGDYRRRDEMTDIIDRAEAVLNGRTVGNRISSQHRIYGNVIRELVSELTVARAQRDEFRAQLEHECAENERILDDCLRVDRVCGEPT